MQKKRLTLISRKYMELKSNIKSWDTVKRNGWYVKFSVLEDQYVLLTFVSSYTGQTVVRYCDGETEACEQINFITSLDPSRKLSELQ